MTKTCSACAQEKPATAQYFGRASNRSDGLYGYCRACCSVKAREFYQKHRERLRAKQRAYRKNFDKLHEIDRRKHLKQHYGLTQADYQQLLEQQGNVCAICGGQQAEKLRRYFDIDHDHATNTIRGLLCSRCNRGLGAFKDDAQIVQKALQYLEAACQKV